MLVSASWLLSFSSFSDVSFSPAAYAGAASSLVGERYENISDNLLWFMTFKGQSSCFESLVFIRNVDVSWHIVEIMDLKNVCY